MEELIKKIRCEFIRGDLEDPNLKDEDMGFFQGMRLRRFNFENGKAVVALLEKIYLQTNKDNYQSAIVRVWQLPFYVHIWTKWCVDMGADKEEISIIYREVESAVKNIIEKKLS